MYMSVEDIDVDSMSKFCEHKIFLPCMYAQEFETICSGCCGLCKFPDLFGNRLKKVHYSVVRFLI